MTRSLNVLLACAAMAAGIASAHATPITRIWLTHNTNTPSALVVNWETAAEGPSRVEYGPSESLGQVAEDEKPATLHHLSVPFPQEGLLYYRVRTGNAQSAIHPVKSYSGETLRVAAAANWFLRPPLDAVLKDDPHLLLSCGDLVIDVVSMEEAGGAAYTKPFANLIGAYPALFARVPFLPVPGNHGRQIGYPEVYDVEATAFRRFFPLPDDGRRFHFAIPAFGVCFAALDVGHADAVGTRYQACQPLDKSSAQFRWYRELVRSRGERFLVTYHNEQNARMRSIERGAWEPLIRQGSVALSGFGSFAERAEVKGFPYFNTGLKTGEDNRDPAGSKYFQAVPSYILMTFVKDSETMAVELKGLDGKTLDRSEWPGHPGPGNRP